jgi:hypothetical protein
MDAKYKETRNLNYPSKHAQLFFIILLLTLCSLSKQFIIGKPNYKIKILVILDISDYKNLIIVREIVEALKYACFKPVEDKILYMNIMLTSDYYDYNTRFMLSYLSYLDQMSATFRNCFSCSLNSFFIALDFVHRVSKEYFRLVDLDPQEFIKEINKVVPYVNKREVYRVLNDISLAEIQSHSNFFFNIFTQSPLVFINSIIINEPHTVDRHYWKNIFRNNFNLEKCKNKEEFFKYLTYYSE